MNGEFGMSDPVKPVKILTQVKHSAETFVFVEENDMRNNMSGWNQNSFWVPAFGDTWIDFPANFHKGCCLSFVDGHAVYYQFGDPRTGKITQPNTTTTNNIDLKNFQKWSGTYNQLY
jgi:hypothetical protein